MSDARTLRSLHRLESNLLEKQEWSELHREKKLEDGLTIVIPNWNHQPYLPVRYALQGLKRLEEDGYSGEIIAIDDASRDGSQKLLRSIQMLYGEPTVKTLFLPQNLGLPRVEIWACGCRNTATCA